MLFFAGFVLWWAVILYTYQFWYIYEFTMIYDTGCSLFNIYWISPRYRPRLYYASNSPAFICSPPFILLLYYRMPAPVAAPLFIADTYPRSAYFIALLLILRLYVALFTSIRRTCYKPCHPSLHHRLRYRSKYEPAIIDIGRHIHLFSLLIYLLTVILLMPFLLNALEESGDERPESAAEAPNAKCSAT